LWHVLAALEDLNNNNNNNNSNNNNNINHHHHHHYHLYLPSAVFIAQRLVGPSKQLKQIIQTEHNIVKNPNWPEANQLSIYKRGRGFELGATVKQIRVVVRAGLEPWTAGCFGMFPNVPCSAGIKWGTSIEKRSRAIIASWKSCGIKLCTVHINDAPSWCKQS